MATTVKDIFDRAGIILRDTEFRQWTEDELLAWYNEALAEVVRVRPEASALLHPQVLVAGSVQDLPANAVQLLRVSLCVESGRAPRRTEIETLDSANPSWQSGTPSDSVKRYAVDGDNPRQFFVFPPNDGTGNIELVYSLVPENVIVSTGLFGLPAIYEAVVLNYILFRAFSKSSEDASHDSQANKYYSLFAEAVGTSDVVSEGRFNKGREATVIRRGS